MDSLRSELLQIVWHTFARHARQMYYLPAAPTATSAPAAASAAADDSSGAASIASSSSADVKLQSQQQSLLWIAESDGLPLAREWTVPAMSAREIAEQTALIRSGKLDCDAVQSILDRVQGK